MFDGRLLVGKLTPKHVRENTLHERGLLAKSELMKLGENSLSRGFTIDSKGGPM
jgi:hypothetical protein